MIALYKVGPEYMELDELQDTVGYQNTSRFRSLLRSASRERMVHMKGDKVWITKKGTAWVEANVEMKIDA